MFQMNPNMTKQTRPFTMPTSTAESVKLPSFARQDMTNIQNFPSRGLGSMWGQGAGGGAGNRPGSSGPGSAGQTPKHMARPSGDSSSAGSDRHNNRYSLLESQDIRYIAVSSQCFL